MLDFKSWLKVTDYRVHKGEKGQFAGDILADGKFPEACEKYIIARYLGTRLDAENKKVFDELYTEYIEFISREFSDDPVPNGNY